MYWNPANREVAAVPRHREISERLTIRICKELGIDPLARS
jgi:hypothetical protein